MKRYNITFKFKSGKGLYFELVDQDDMKEVLAREWEESKKDGAIMLKDYIISTDDIQWIRIEEGESFEKHSK